MADRMLRFFPYIGAKHRYASNYPKPIHDLVIEPFAGSAAYCTKNAPKRAILIEKNPRLAAVWKWLIKVSEREFMALPTIEDYDRVSDTGLDGPAADYLRLWCNEASSCHFGDKVSGASRSAAAKRPRSRWTIECKALRAGQLGAIRGWVAVCGDYSDAPDAEATWFIDPPYMNGGHMYSESVSAIDHARLAEWCKSRRGQAIVCEGDGADWLNFRPLCRAMAGGHANGAFSSGKRTELVWLSQEQHREIHGGDGDD